MKKYILSLVIPSLVVTAAISFISQAQAQTPVVVCPAGYTCTPIPPQPVNCPIGYICSVTNPTPTPTPTPGPACYTFTKNLNLGSRGAEVVALQTWLISQGYRLPRIEAGLAAKGYYGSETLAAVRAYQRNAGIEASGVFGPQTRAKVNASCGPTNTNSPYISSVTNPISPESTMTVRGQRLTNGVIYIDGIERDTVGTVRSTDGTSLSFRLPTLLNGQHVIELRDSSTGASNRFTFTVGDVVTPVVCPVGYICSPTPGTPQVGNCPANYTCELIGTNPSITVVSPVGGEVYSDSSIPVTWTQTHSSTRVNLLLNRNGITYYKVYAPSGQGKNDFIMDASSYEIPFAGGYQIQICDDNVKDASGKSYCSALTNSFSIGSSTPTCPSGYTCTSPVTITANLLDASSDRIGSGFNSSVGINNRNPADWHFRLAISSDRARDIKEIYIKHNAAGEGWSTTNRASILGTGPYPLLVSGSAYVNTSFDQVIPASAGDSLDLYAQPESGSFRGGMIVVTFTDGTVAQASIPASSVRQATGVACTTTDSRCTVVTSGASLLLSVAANTPKRADIVATGGVNSNEIDKVALLSFNLRAGEGAVTVNNLAVNVVKSGAGSATVSTVYLYDGNTEIDSTTVNSGGTATFNNVDTYIEKDATKTLWVKVDIINANTPITSFVASVLPGNIVAVDSRGGPAKTSDGVPAIGNQIGVSNKGAEIVLLAKSVTVSGTNNSGSTISTSTVTATFDIAVTAKGGDILMGQAGSTSPALTFGIYSSGGTLRASSDAVSPDVNGMVITSISTPMPDGVTQDATNKSFTIQKNNTANMRVTFSYAGKNAAGQPLTDTYSVGIRSVDYVIDGTPMSSTFMADEPAWRTDFLKALRNGLPDESMVAAAVKAFQRMYYGQ